MTNPYFAKASQDKDEKWVLDEKYGGDVSAKGFAEDCARLAKGEPVAYVIGWQPFLGLKIYLDSRPLIPRPETEWWTELLLKYVANDDSEVFRSASARGAAIFQQKNTRPLNRIGDMSFLDLCSGSGAIGCATLKMLPHADVYFGEIDPAHESTILKNIRENNLDGSRAQIKIGDLFEPFADMKFDVIAVNPPYIPEDRELPLSVTSNEPSLALRSGKDGLDLIRRIASELPRRLKRDGVAWIECDSEHTASMQSVFTNQGLSIKILTDQFGKQRIIVVSFM